MCEYPGTEWAITSQEPCINTDPRRADGNETRDVSELGSEETRDVSELGSIESVESVDSNATESGGEQDSENTELTGGNGTETQTAPALRSRGHARYDIDYAMDGHRCPQHCPLVYRPVCVNINRGYGKHFKLLHFSNHCEADRHYCTNWETAYKPPAGMDEPLYVKPSNAAWSFCASGSYMNFMTFAQTATSMSHYGWLAGPQRAQHIMEPHERIPGTG